jgi:hypothetical protein
MREKIEKIYASHKDMLLEKNRRYGNSALEPIGVFYKGEAGESIKIRLDDKLGRVKNSQELRKNDVSDLIGYLVLLCVDNDWLDFIDQVD